MTLHPNELIVDSFAGGGGASTGMDMALGRSPDVAYLKYIDQAKGQPHE